jgi:hypothetical protein
LLSDRALEINELLRGMMHRRWSRSIWAAGGCEERKGGGGDDKFGDFHVV